jgi:hypothetical protein
VVVITAGMDWGQPYSCSGWAESFGLTIPILDDNSGNNIYGLFGIGYVPHNVVIGGDGTLIFTDSGFNQGIIIDMIEEGLSNLVLDMDADGVMDDADNCMEDYNPNQADVDQDGIGDICDACNNVIWTGGDVNADLELSIEDILILVDVVLGENESQCAYEAGDITMDGVLNILDVIGLVQYIFGGNRNQAMMWIQNNFTEEEFKNLTYGYFVSEKVLAWPNPSNSYVSLNGSGNTKIYDITGRMVKELELSGTYRWDTKTLPSGIYNIHNNMEITTITILK